MSERLLTAESGKQGGILWSGTVKIPDNLQRTLFIWGTWGEATVQVQVSPNGKDWIPLSEQVATKNGWLPVRLSPGVFLRAGIVNPSGSTSLNVEYV